MWVFISMPNALSLHICTTQVSERRTRSAMPRLNEPWRNLDGWTFRLSTLKAFGKRNCKQHDSAKQRRKQRQNRWTTYPTVTHRQAHNGWWYGCSATGTSCASFIREAWGRVSWCFHDQLGQHKAPRSYFRNDSSTSRTCILNCRLEAHGVNGIGLWSLCGKERLEVDLLP